MDYKRICDGVLISTRMSDTAGGTRYAGSSAATCGSALARELCPLRLQLSFPTSNSHSVWTKSKPIKSMALVG